MRTLGAAAAVAITLLVGVPSTPKASAAAQLGPPLTQPACPGVTTTERVFSPGIPLLDWREELVFDGHGGLWVSRLERNVLERYDSSGAVTATLAIPGPGGLALGPDGLVYVNSQATNGPANVVRFDPRLAHPIPTLFAQNLPGVNGSAFDSQGNLYISTEGASPSVLKLRPDGSRDQAWEQQASFYGANGLAVARSLLFAAVTFDERSPVEVVPLDDPSARHTIALLSFGILSREPRLYLPPNVGAPLIPKGLDDLTVGPDGAIYVVGFASGELLRVDPTTGDACVVASGFTTPTAVQFPHAFGPYDPQRDAFVTEAAGDVVVVHLG